MNNTETIYNTSNIKDALSPATIYGLLTLPPGEVIRVAPEEFDLAFAELEESCAEKWSKIGQNDNRNSTGTFRVLYSAMYHCHRADTYEQQHSERTVQKDTKKCKCKATLKVTQKAGTSFMTTERTNDHAPNHVPGSASGMRTPPLNRAASAAIDGMLRFGVDVVFDMFNLHLSILITDLTHYLSISSYLT
jgi:hypothetical protein